MRPNVTWRDIAGFMLFYAVVVLGGGLVALVLMRECGDGWLKESVLVFAVIALVGGLTALLRGVPSRSVRLAVGGVAVGVYVLAVGWCNRWTSDDERALRGWQERQSAPKHGPN
jgi:low temperature requirement protein LtrA